MHEYYLVIINNFEDFSKLFNFLWLVFIWKNDKWRHGTNETMTFFFKLLNFSKINSFVA